MHKLNQENAVLSILEVAEIEKGPVSTETKEEYVIYQETCFCTNIV